MNDGMPMPFLPISPIIGGLPPAPSSDMAPPVDAPVPAPTIPEPPKAYETPLKVPPKIAFMAQKLYALHGGQPSPAPATGAHQPLGPGWGGGGK